MSRHSSRDLTAILDSKQNNESINKLSVVYDKQANTSSNRIRESSGVVETSYLFKLMTVKKK